MDLCQAVPAQLLSHYDEVISMQEAGLNADVVYLDFAKAFDKVDHNIVLHKLKKTWYRRSHPKMDSRLSIK